MGLLSTNLFYKGMMVGDLICVEKKEFIHLALAEANTERRDSGGQIGLFYHEWHRPGNRRLVLKSPHSSKACRLESVGQNHKALWVRGSGPCRELIG